MKRDTRLGAEHWTGCYVFENIICDGNVEQPSGPRHGGLKMGGTYWYYYQLNNDVDYHNPAEPSTTSCPMLPGQVVNVLNVPVHFSSGHHKHRNATVSSTSSQLWTMNPQDKYLNPRPAPNPIPTRSNTSASQTSAPDPECLPSITLAGPGCSRHRRIASLPSSAVSLKSFRLPRKASRDAGGRLASPPHRSTGLRAAFRQFSPLAAAGSLATVSKGYARSTASQGEILSLDKGCRSDHVADGTFHHPDSSAHSKTSAGSGYATPVLEQDSKQASKQAQDGIMALSRNIRRLDNVECALTTSSCQYHRIKRSRSEETSLRNPLTQAEPPRGDCTTQEASRENHRSLDTSEEVLSAQNTPLWPSLDTNIPENEYGEIDPRCKTSNKRLPTLPSTPSLAYFPNGGCESPWGVTFNEVNDLQSGLSKVTVSDECLSSTDQSCFSHWTCTTANSSSSSPWSTLFFDGASPPFNRGDDPSSQSTSPYEMASAVQNPGAVKGLENSSSLDASRIPSIISSSTISSSDNASPSSPISETFESTRARRDESTSLQRRYGVMLGSVHGYKLPVDADISQSNQNCRITHPMDGQPPNVYSDYSVGDTLPQTITEEYSTLTGMQQLMSELGYLGDMIQISSMSAQS